MDYVVRLANAADEPFLWEMLYHAAHMQQDGATSAQEARDNPFLAAFVEGWGQPGDLGVLAVVGERPVGAAWLRVLAGQEHDYSAIPPTAPEIAIAVLPEYAGGGIGTRLLNHLLDAARHTYSAVVLSVRADNPARRLYERLGFEMVGETTNRVGGMSFVMLKRL